MNHKDNINIAQINQDTFDRLKATHTDKEWLRIKINDLSLRSDHTRFSNEGKLHFRTAYSDHNGANRTMQYQPAIELPPSCSVDGRYDLEGAKVELMWVNGSDTFLVRVEHASCDILYYYCKVDLVKAKPTRSMSLIVNRVSEEA